MSRDKFEIISPEKLFSNELAEREVLAMYYYQPSTPASLLKADYFYNSTYRKIYTCIDAIQAEGALPTPSLIYEYISQLPNYDRQGNQIIKPTAQDIISLGDNISDSDASAAFGKNISILKEYAKKRKLKDLGIKALEASTSASAIDVDEALHNISLSADILENSSISEFADDLTPLTEKEVKEELCQGGGDLRTGFLFESKDQEDSELLIHDRAITFIAAPTSHGKSTMLENLALRILQYNINKKVLYLSYEEDKGSVLTSFLTIYCAKNKALPSRWNIRSTIKNDLKGNDKYVSREAKDDYESAKASFFNLLKDKALNIRYKDYDIDKLVSYIKFMKSNNACDVVLIDYMQLLSLSGSTRLSRQEQLKEICLKLKDLAVSEKYGLPIILAAQFNRQVVSPLDLISTNIREAGDIEQIANTIVAMWNCGFTNPSDKVRTASQLEAEYKGLSEINKEKIYAKIIKRRGQEPNIKTMFDFDGKTGLITGKDEPQASTQKEDSENDSFF